MGLSEIINSGLNNPECAFFTGQMFGQFFAIKVIVAIAVLNFIIKATDKLALEPLLEFIKKKIKKKINKN